MFKRVAYLVPMFLMAGCGMATGQIDPMLVANNNASIDAAALRGPTFGHLDIEQYLRKGNLPLANPTAAPGGSTPEPVAPGSPAVTAQADRSAMSDVAIFAEIDANEAVIADVYETDYAGRVHHTPEWLDRVNAAEAAHPELKAQGEFLKSVSSKDVAAVHKAFRQDVANLDSAARAQKNSQWRAGQPGDRLGQFGSRYATMFGPAPVPSTPPTPQPSPSAPAPSPSPSDSPMPSSFFNWL